MEHAVDLIGLAEILHVSVDTVRTKANAGKIPGFKVGRMWRFMPSVVVAHLAIVADPWARSAGSKRATARRAA